MAAANNNNQHHHKPHFLIVTYPAQGHINPALQFAKRLIRLGARATFLTTLSAYRRMNNPPILDDQLFTFQTFSDGYDDGFKASGDKYDAYKIEIRRRGSQAITDLIVSNENLGRPFNYVTYTLLLPWAAEVAREFHLPSAMLWIQPATVLNIYYYYFNGHKDAIENTATGSAVALPGVSVEFTGKDLPSFLDPTKDDIYNIKPTFQEQMDVLNEDPNPTVLVNSFDKLEPEALKSIEKFKMIAVGPLLPSAFLDGKDPNDNSFGNNARKWKSFAREAAAEGGSSDQNLKAFIAELH
ncbi:hypothetical protein ACFE04_007307 [Oxalis oulophora]